MDIKEVIIIFVILNVLAYLIIHFDKRNSRSGKKRVSEASLLTMAAIGGSIGILVGMFVYRHKTRKKRFSLGVPLIIAMQILLIVGLA